ncbi:hypothetical protein L226DRAFT_566088 [Lentinus tigrinus ALCF2SS1-7]|uniref:Uncharacterized protein n=1 Tax=Lentinus tigrinus ALCF2SS1-6 TaxID=1328759 RepID=A0A5C2SU20_9APHY|nr:hypothetical protein L227DRAFT_605751 [Lentinus tigrinus ALCF2SS1-6]RPD81303.1 hypothetical protein L226DRAFT_566088 [Lentinus tigrinus ALCF2SS1-7]
MSSQSADISDEDSRASAYEPTVASDKGRRSRSTRGEVAHVDLFIADTRYHYSLRPLPENEEQMRTPPECFRPSRLSRLRGLGLNVHIYSHKRGPPKGYILALERRLHQVEALLGTIIGSDDPRARGLVQDLSRDKLANHIIQKVNVGPFGPRGRQEHPFSTTKEDFLASISTEINDSSSEQSSSGLDSSGDLAFCSPGSDWQDKLRILLSACRAESSLSPAGGSNLVTSTPHERTRRATFPSAYTEFPPTPSTVHSSGLNSPYSPGSPGTLFSLHGWCPESLLRTNIDPANHQVAQSPTGPSGLLHVMDDIYVDADGRVRL